MGDFMNLSRNNRGSTFIGVFISTFLIFLSIFTALKYIFLMENQKINNQVKYKFYNNINNIVELASSYDWKDMPDEDLIGALPREFSLLKEEDMRINYQVRRGSGEDLVNVLLIEAVYDDSSGAGVRKNIVYSLEQSRY